MANQITHFDDNPNHQVTDSAMSYIAEVKGAAFCSRISAGLGGVTIKLPRLKSRLTDSHALVVAIGRKDAEDLIELLGGEQFYIPRGPGVSNRALAVFKATRAGQTNFQIARELGISDRHVRRLRAKTRDVLRRNGPAERS